MIAEYGFLGTDIDLSVTATGVNLSTATEIKCIFRKLGIADVTLTKTGSDISVTSSTTCTVSIDKTDITIGGMYEIRLVVTEASGRVRGMKLDVTHLILE